MSWDDDFPGARASRPRSQVPNQQLINPFIAVHSCPFVVRRSPWSPFAVLRGPSWKSFAFSWKSFLPLATLRRPLSSLLQPLSGPSPFFVALRGYLFAFFRKSFPLARPLADPSQASSNPLVALRRSSWPFVDIFLPFPGNPFPPSRPLADPSQASSNPLVALRGPSCPFVDNSFPLPSQICPTPN